MNFDLTKLSKKEQIQVLIGRMGEQKFGNIELGLDDECDLHIENTENCEKIFLQDATNYEDIIESLEKASKFLLNYAEIIKIKISDEEDGKRKK